MKTLLRPIGTAAISLFLIGLVSAEALGVDRTTHHNDAWFRNLRFAHLTTNDGLSQSNVKAILQDDRGFMWFA
ncbi:MAG TPA: hypothetical protein VMH23_08425, partial [Bacteroidota bacterium]|nr:hypothetical protein [Bacteroidota bacterium]